MRSIYFDSDGDVANDLHRMDEIFMGEALQEAHKALSLNEVPIGAVVVCAGKVIGRGHNLTERLNDVTAHAEMQAFTAASDYLGGKYLINCTLYVTLEPCVMCAGAAYWTQIGRIVYGASDAKRGYGVCKQNLLHPKTKVSKGVMALVCGQLLSGFFAQRRK